MEIPFVGGAYQGRSLNLDSQVCQNLYPVVYNEGGKKVLALMGVPGLIPWESSLPGLNYLTFAGNLSRIYGTTGTAGHSFSFAGEVSTRLGNLVYVPGG